MAINFPGAKLFTAGDAKSRVIIVFVVVVALGTVIYFGSRFLGSDADTTGPSQVASAPGGLQSVPGGKTSAEYSRALLQANEQAAQQAQMSGGSAVPTLINVSGQAGGFSQTNCSVVCPDDGSADVAADINDLVRQGSISPDSANRLLDLAKKNVTPEEYATELERLVKEGKLTPEQARRLLSQYKKQYDHGKLLESATGMDPLIKEGDLPVDVANSLLTLQKIKVPPAEYDAELDRLVKQGRISPQVATQLLGQYNQQQKNDALKKNEFELKQLADSGTITRDVANRLTGLRQQNAPISDYAGELQRLVAAGNLTPAAASKLLEEYKAQNTNAGNTAALNGLVGQTEAALEGLVNAAHMNQIDALARSGDLSPEAAAILKKTSLANYEKTMAELVKNGQVRADVADKLNGSNLLRDLEQKNVSPEEYEKALAELVRSGKLSPEDAKRLLVSYRKLHGVKSEVAKLTALQESNAPQQEYDNELKLAVANGVVTPEQAAALAQSYQASIANAATVSAPETIIPGATDFNKLQRQLQQRPAELAVVSPTDNPNADFAAAAAAERDRRAQERQQRIQQMSQAMASQAQVLITSWQPSKMQHVQGAAEEKGVIGAAASGQASSQNGSIQAGADGAAGIDKPPLIKTGTILFAVLDTAVDSDYPDTPVMATVVQGPFKGSKLLGKLAVVQGKDRISLTFNMMDQDNWIKTKSVNAFAIDPDTARTVMASSVDYHYFMRYGALMAASFLTGYSSAITQAGSSTTGIFGTSTTHPNLSPGNRLAVGLGQIGTNLTGIVQTYVNTPPTIKINAGVGLGILFMGDVT